MPRPTPASPESTIEALLDRSKRHAVPIRQTFVQQGTQGKPKPGPLAGFVHAHDERGLKLYLLFLAAASSEPWDVTLPAGAWARAAEIRPTAGVSKVWKRLEDRRLIRRSRAGRKAAVTALREDGSGEAYCHPHTNHERYFRLPFTFWTAEQRWYRTLDLSETALLLIGLSLPDGFLLPSDKARRWYGLSSDTVERGLRGLANKHLLRIDRKWKPAPLTGPGYTLERRYTLLPPFGPKKPRDWDGQGVDLADLTTLFKSAAASPGTQASDQAEATAAEVVRS